MMHYTLNDLIIEITYRNEKQSTEAWLIGARVMEAIGVCFGKGQKYSEKPQIYTKEEMFENERLEFEKFVARYAR